MKNGKYTLIVAPKNYPGKKYRERYIYEHHLVWWEKTGIVLPEGYNIHHKNEKKRDNRFSNLEMISNKTHSSLHSREKENKWIALICEFCKQPFQRLKRNVMYKKNYQTRFYCCRSHQVKNQKKVMTGKVSWIELKCPICNKRFKKLRSTITFRKKSGQINFYCSRTCMGKAPLNLIERLKSKKNIADYDTGIIPN